MKNVTYILITALMLLLCISCHNDEGDYSALETQERHISFTLQLGNGCYGDTRTRVGSDFETKVDETNIHALIYDGTKYVGKVENITLQEAGSVNGVYTFKGHVRLDLITGRKYRFVVIANCGVPTDPDMHKNTTFVAIPIGEWIPMWGVTTYTVTEAKDQQLSSIALIRAVAKVEVKLHDNLQKAGFKIKRVTINKAAKRGLAFPKKWLTLSETPLHDMSPYFNPAINSPIVAKDFHLYDGTTEVAPKIGGNRAQIYIPEYDNTTDPVNAAKLSVVVTDKDKNEKTFSDYIEFKNYANGRPIDGTLSNVIRNVFYSYTINSIGHELSLTANVLPWDFTEESWDYTDQISIREEGKLRWDDGTYATVDAATSTVVLKPSVTLSGTFTIDSPVGSKWFATFIPKSGMNNSFVFKINGQRTASGNVGEPATIKIDPIYDQISKNNVATLRIIVVTPDGRTLNVNELLPSEYGSKEYTVIQIK